MIKYMLLSRLPALVLMLCLLLCAYVAPSRGASLDYVSRACSVYCSGPLLEAVQMLGLYNDSKTFVDMPMLQDHEAILDAFATVDASDRSAVQAFVDRILGDLAELAEESARLDGHPKVLGQLFREHIASAGIDAPELAWHVKLFL